jgi:hypothetical protein
MTDRDSGSVDKQEHDRDIADLRLQACALLQHPGVHQDRRVPQQLPLPGLTDPALPQPGEHIRARRVARGCPLYRVSKLIHLPLLALLLVQV